MDNQTKVELLSEIPSAQSVRKETQENENYKIAISQAIKNLNKRIEEAKKKGLTDTSFGGFSYKHEDELKRLYKEKGYWFKPTGFIGGVYQTTEQICW
jgi:hypothetical protein